MSVLEVLDKYIQKQITAGNEDFAFRLAEYSGKHHNDEGHPHYYPDMDEYNAPEEIRTRFGDWIQDNADIPYHADDDREILWDLFLEQMEREQMDEDGQEMSYWENQYNREKATKPVEMPREDMPLKMRMREDLYGKDASNNLKKVLSKYINYDFIQKMSEEKGKTKWEDERTKWNKKKDQELGAESRPTKRNSELEETESQKKKEHTTIKESQIWEKRKARWASWKNKNTKTASKDIWIEAFERISNGEELCPHDGEYLDLDEENNCGVCPKCGFRLSVDDLATDIISNQIDRDYDMYRESKNLNKMIAKYANLDAFGRPYQGPFNGRTQNNWEDMLGRWDKYLGPDYGVSKAPKKNPCVADEFINIPTVTASKTLKTMLNKYAQQQFDDFDTQIHPEEDFQFDDFDTQIHPEEDFQAEQYEAELSNLKVVDDLMKEYGHYYHTEELKRAFKEGLQVGIRGY